MKKAFTILEMLIVLSIIALLFLLTLPNISQKQAIIEKRGCEALIEVVNGQIILYEIEHKVPPKNISTLINEGYLKDGQQRCPNGLMIEIYNGQAEAH